MLVGRVGDRVLWPAVFDYEHMGRDNPIARDFVKMETEIKIRAYPLVFPTALSEFVPAVAEFESALFEQTERARESGSWPHQPADPDCSRDRLAWLLLKLRQAAGAHLGANRGRPGEWLDEYYFALGLYGLNAVRFTNLSRLERLGAYQSAGTALARYLAYRPALGHRPKLTCIKEDWRAASDKTAALEAAVSGLTDLQARYPYVVAIGAELALVLDQLGRADQGMAVLADLERRFPRLDAETFCRWGKVFKRQAEATTSGRSAAYRQAEYWYGRAYDVDRAFYPRINQLACKYLRAATDDDAGLAAEVKAEALALLADGPAWAERNPDDRIWVPATRGEALLLSGDWEAAVGPYREALAAAGGKQFYADSMADQVRRLLPAARALAPPPTGPLTDPDTFFCVPPLAELRDAV